MFSIRILLIPLLALLTGLSVVQAQTLTNDRTTITVRAGSTLYVTGAVQNNAGSNLAIAGTLQVTGNLTNAGTLAVPGCTLPRIERQL